MKEEYWVGNNGIPIAVGDMTEEHIRNCLRKLIRENRIISSKKCFTSKIKKV
jgi:hypothetical protein